MLTLYLHQRNEVEAEVAETAVKTEVIAVKTAVIVVITGLRLLPKHPTWKVSQKQSSPHYHNASGLSRRLCLLLNTEHKLSEHRPQTRCF